MPKLSRLFRWSKKVDIRVNDKIVDTVYIRLVGDVVFQDARKLALKESRTLRAKLRNTESEEYKSNFSDIDFLTKDELVNGILVGEMSTFRDEAMMEYKVEEVPELSDNPSMEEQEEHDEKIDALQSKRIKTLTDAIESKADARKKMLDVMENKELISLYTRAMCEVRCTDAFTDTFREYQVYMGTFTDKSFKVLAFDSFQDFRESSATLKELLTNAYNSLEISGEDLKN